MSTWRTDATLEAVIARGGELCPEHHPLVALARELEQELQAALEALRDLYDEQNGPPLLTDALDWQQAMEHALGPVTEAEAQAALAAE